VSETTQPESADGGEKEHFNAADLGLEVAALPADDAEAEARFQRWRERDPFPRVAPALLNSADLFDYIATTGMIHPFKLDSMRVDESLKPASCGIRIGGPCAYWSYEGPADGRKPELIERKVGENDVLTLPPNSIVYATLAPRFRLPDYIAARFNLSIRYVYRGLLVGTGPLVDPGFAGPLQIPLHNLTSTPCEISTADAVLWMEFTKLSPRPEWVGDEEEARAGAYVPFPKRKQRVGLGEYLEHANQGGAIVSSIPAAVEEASSAAHEAAVAAKAAATGSKVIRIATLIAAVVGTITLLSFVNDLRQSAHEDAGAALQRSNELEQQVIELRARVKRQEEHQSASERQQTG
jgi:deoxycytidine triphosphate deaminase